MGLQIFKVKEAFKFIRSPLRKVVSKIGKAELILFIISTLVTLLILESGARIWLSYFAAPEQYKNYALYTGIDSNEWIYSPHPYLNYYLTPNYKSEDGLQYHNSLGYRNKEFPLKKPSGEYRIAILGASTTYDTSIHDNEKTFTFQLERILKKEYGYQNVKVINAGVGGYSSWESLINLEFRVLDVEPDLIIVYHGVNDVTQRMVIPAEYRGDNTGSKVHWLLPPVKLFEYSCLLRIISRKMGFSQQIDVYSLTIAPTNLIFHAPTKNTNFTEILKSNPPIYFERNLRNMIAIAKEHHIEIMLVTFAFSTAFKKDRHYASFDTHRLGMRQQNLVIRNIATDYNIPVFDFASVMPEDIQYYADRVHNNEKGALLKAKLFGEFIHKEALVNN